MISDIVIEVSNHEHIISNKSLEGIKLLIEIKNMKLTYFWNNLANFMHEKDHIISEKKNIDKY